MPSHPQDSSTFLEIIMCDALEEQNGKVTTGGKTIKCAQGIK